jgi:hypothetical protein
MRSKFAGVAAGVAVAVTVASSGCGAVLGIKEEPPVDAGADVVAQVDAGGVDRCPGRARVPERPSTSDAPSIPAVVFAAEDLRIDASNIDSSLAKPKGFDLDTTCDGVEPLSCSRPATAPPPASEPEGRDDVLGPLLADLASLTPVFAPEYVERRISYGLYSVLIEVKEWNGTDNDPKVSVTFRSSVGTARDANGSPALPRFDGQDRWDVDPSSMTNGAAQVGEDCSNVPCIGPTDVDAYVRDGNLVAHWPGLLPFMLAGERSISLPMSGALLVAKLEKNGSAFRLTGELGGRTSANQLLGIASVVTDPGTSKAICSAPTVYALFKKSVCASVDIAAKPEDDHKGVACDALSTAISFAASPALLGKVRAPAEATSDCPNFKDSCWP